MPEFASIQKLWTEHLSRPFPRALAGEEFDGHCLVMLDTEAAGCIAGFVNGTRLPGLDAKRVQILSDCAARLSRICPQLPEEHRGYFETLQEISERIARYCRRGSHD